MRCLLIVLALAGGMTSCASFSLISPEQEIWVTAEQLGPDSLYHCRLEAAERKKPICRKAVMVDAAGTPRWP